MSTNGTRDFQGTIFLDTLGGQPIGTVLPPGPFPAKVEAYVQDTGQYWQTERVGPGPLGMVWVFKGGGGVLGGIAPLYAVNVPGALPATGYTDPRLLVARMIADGASPTNPKFGRVYPGVYDVGGLVIPGGVHLAGFVQGRIGATVFVNGGAPTLPTVTFAQSAAVAPGVFASGSLSRVVVLTVGPAAECVLVDSPQPIYMTLHELVLVSFGSGRAFRLAASSNGTSTLYFDAISAFHQGAPSPNNLVDFERDLVSLVPGFEQPIEILNASHIETAPGSTGLALRSLASMHFHGVHVIGGMELSGPMLGDIRESLLAAEGRSVATLVGGATLAVRTGEIRQKNPGAFDAIAGAGFFSSANTSWEGGRVIGASVATDAPETADARTEKSFTGALAYSPAQLAGLSRVASLGPGAADFNLPDITRVLRGEIRLVKQVGALAINVRPFLGQTIDGLAVFALAAPGAVVRLQASPTGTTDWRVV